MTDFTEGHHNKCNICGTRYFEPEGKACTCWKCDCCGEEFTNLIECANKELLLCVYCEDERLQAERSVGFSLMDVDWEYRKPWPNIPNESGDGL